MSEWKTLSTFQEVAEAQKNGEEIETDHASKTIFSSWHGDTWKATYSFRSRPAKKTKTVVLREALMRRGIEVYWTGWYDKYPGCNFVKWLDTPERIVEVEL